jgi:patatin-like phospholipase/acyl hydrolase
MIVDSSNIRYTPRILSLDGGGVRGLSSLLVLQEIMKEAGLKTGKEKREDSPRPCEYFDLICGTSTGGLIAIMLGLLRMVCFALCGNMF